MAYFNRPLTPDQKTKLAPSVAKTVNSSVDKSTAVASKVNTTAKKRRPNARAISLNAKETTVPPLTSQPSLGLIDLLDVPIPIMKKP